MTPWDRLAILAPIPFLTYTDSHSLSCRSGMGIFTSEEKGKWRPRNLKTLWCNYLFIVRIFYGAISSLQ